MGPAQFEEYEGPHVTLDPAVAGEDAPGMFFRSGLHGFFRQDRRPVEPPRAAAR